MVIMVEKSFRQFIDKTIHLSLASVSGDRPWVCEVHFAYDEQLNLYFRSLTSRRHSREIAKNRNVAGNSVKQHQANEEMVGVYFEGTSEIVEDRQVQQVQKNY